MTMNESTTTLKAAIFILILTVLVATERSFRNEVGWVESRQSYMCLLGELIFPLEYQQTARGVFLLSLSLKPPVVSLSQHCSFTYCNVERTPNHQVFHRGDLRGSRRLQDTPEITGGNNLFPIGNEKTVGNNPVPIGSVESGGINNLGETDPLLRIPDQIPLFPLQPAPPVKVVVDPLSGGSNGGAFSAFGKVFLRGNSPGINLFPLGNEETAGNNPVPIGSVESGGINNLGETDPLLRIPDQIPLFPLQPAPPVKVVLAPFSGGSNGGAFGAFGEKFLNEDPGN
jgi:hypothetical protein